MLTSGMLGAGCGRDGGVPDDELGELVLAPKRSDHAIDVASAASDARELGRALGLPHHKVAALLGPHRLRISSSLEVSEAGKVVEQLQDEIRLDFDSPAAWHGTSNNSADYGRETIFTGGSLFLRARYQRFHQRPPTNDAEPASLADRFFDAGAATWDLLSPGAAIADAGTATVAGRAGRKIAISSASAPSKPARETLTQRKWRESRTVEGVQGEAVLDAQSGAPLALDLRGVVGFMREGKAYSMKVAVKAEVTDFGRPDITPPDPAEVVQTPGRMHEVDERDKLLERIAPPLRGADRSPAKASDTGAAKAGERVK